MNRLFGLILVIPIVFIALIYSFILFHVQEDINDFEEYRLEQIVNYATDGAIEELLNADDLGMDYIAMGKASLNPANAKDTFVKLFALSYDLPLNKTTIEMVESSYISVLIVNVYDGYYVYDPQQLSMTTNSTRHENLLVCSPKYPFSIAKSPYTYALNFGFSKLARLSSSSLEYVDFSTTGITQTEAYASINRILSNEINSRLERQSKRGAIRNVDLPIQALTLGGLTNRVDGMSVIAIVTNVNFATSKKLNAFSIGGAKAETTRMVACYTRGGRKLYSYVDLIPTSYAPSSNIQQWAEHVVTSVEAAAALGYYCDIELMTK